MADFRNLVTSGATLGTTLGGTGAGTGAAGDELRATGPGPADEAAADSAATTADLAEEFQARRNRKSQSAAAVTVSASVAVTTATEAMGAAASSSSSCPSLCSLEAQPERQHCGAALVTSIFMQSTDSTIGCPSSDEFNDPSAQQSSEKNFSVLVEDGQCCPESNQQRRHREEQEQEIEKAATAAANVVSVSSSGAGASHLGPSSALPQSAPAQAPAPAQAAPAPAPIQAPAPATVAIAVVKKPTNLVAGQSSFLDKAAPVKSVVVSSRSRFRSPTVSPP
jgi:hypothetical protein